MAYRVVNEVDGALEYRGEKRDFSKINPGGGGSVETNGHSRSGTAGVGAGSKMDEDEERDAVFFRLEMLGYRVGQGLVERWVNDFASYSHVLCSGCQWTLFLWRWRQSSRRGAKLCTRVGLTFCSPDSLAIGHDSRIH